MRKNSTEKVIEKESEWGKHVCNFRYGDSEKPSTRR